MTKAERLRALSKSALKELLEWLVLQDRLSEEDGYSGWTKEERIAYLARKLDETTVRAICRAARDSPPHFKPRALTRTLGLPSKEGMLSGYSKAELRKLMKKLGRTRQIRVDWTRYTMGELIQYISRACSLEELGHLTGLLRAPRKKRSTGGGGTEQRADRSNRPSTVAKLARLVGESLTITEPGNGWPVVGRVQTTYGTIPVSVYARPVGLSGRGRDQERRFQNPVDEEEREIHEPDAGYCLLLGLWDEQGEDRAIIVAFDAYRRLRNTKRFSLFMPVSLLEKAADTGFADHTSQSGEVLYAFRPENLAQHVGKLLVEMPIKGLSLEREAPAVEPAPTVKIAQAPPPEPNENSDADETSAGSTVQIRPRVGMYAAFARLNYKPWFAIAEFVDNSIQSYLHHREKLEQEEAGPLRVDVEIDEDDIRVTDRAGGIAWADFPRAFSPSQPPPDASGLSEFGLGMKAAACWFARRWSVRTSALGEDVARTVEFDIPKIVRESVEELPISSETAKPSDHFTVLSLRNLRVRPRGRTIGKIKDHLTSIYRVLMRNGFVKIRVTSAGRDHELTWENPTLLEAPYFRKINGPSTIWRKEFDFRVGSGRVWGWAGLLAVGKQSEAGFSVFRRDRLIEGSADDSYRPRSVFGSRNSFRQQRLVGELFVEGFNVSHTKDGIQWAGAEDDMLEILRRELDGGDLPLLKQADGYRSRKPARELETGFAKEALESTVGVLQAAATGAAVSQQLGPVPDSEEPDSQVTDGPPERTLTTKNLTIRIAGERKAWNVSLELIADPARDWYGCGVSETEDEQQLIVFVNLAHPFSERFLNDSEEIMAPLLRVVAALGLSEQTARVSGLTHVGEIRRRVNDLLRDALSQTPTGAS